MDKLVNLANMRMDTGVAPVTAPTGGTTMNTAQAHGDCKCRCGDCKCNCYCGECKPG